MKSYLPLLGFLACAFGIIFKKPYLIQGHKYLHVCFLLRVPSFTSLMYFELLLWCEAGFQFYSSVCGLPIIPEALAENQQGVC